MSEHLKSCSHCELRLRQFRQADALLSRVRMVGVPSGRAVASVSLAAALLVSLAANLLLAPGDPHDPHDPRPPFSLSAAPSDTLASFYERVASSTSPGPETRR